MSKELTCIVVDDEAISRDTLKNYLEKYCENITVLACCENIQEGLQAIKKYQPSIVFLDIEMPYGDGFDLLDQVENINFDVVFITAFSDYAIRALNMSATYYILKPIDIDELIAAVDKIRNRTEISSEESIQSKILLENLKVANQQNQRIVLPQLSGFIVLPIASILYAAADDNYTTIYLTDGKKHLVSKTLKFFDELLQDAGFIRIHKSYLINGNEIVEFKKGKTGQVKLSNGVWLDISLQRKQAFLDWFG